MTRFARAKGSKASNERTPEDSTPWEVMKEQLLQTKKQTEEAKKREEAEKQRIENYENFLKEHKSQKRKATWCDFPEAEKPKPKESSVVVEPPTKKKKKNKQKQNGTTPQQQPTETETELNTKIEKSKKKKQKKQKLNETGIQEQNVAHESNNKSVEEIIPVETPGKKNKKTKQKVIDESLQTSQLQNENHMDKNDLTSTNNKTKNKKNKKQKNGPLLKGHENDNNAIQNNKQKKPKKEIKVVDGVPVRRKPINDRSFQLIINGKEVELIRFDGFPIMKKDAERLEELKTNMIKKGIPKSEVNRTLKLERRRAEKALARLKRDVCYNCRKGGHNLSDCPELKTKIPGVGAPEGVCFKCGSTEHRQFECKVQRDKEFRFATCFICKEPGHIARQCPDNPKGLYPNGGSCKLCGDVTHLRKDCPTTMGQKEETSIKLQTLDSTDTLEGIEQKTNTTPQEASKKPKKIKF